MSSNKRIIESEYEGFENSDVNLQSALVTCEDTSFSIALGDDSDAIFFNCNGSGAWNVEYSGDCTLTSTIFEKTRAFLEEPEYSSNLRKFLRKFFEVVEKACIEDEDCNNNISYDSDEFELENGGGGGEDTPEGLNAIAHNGSFFHKLSTTDQAIRAKNLSALTKAEEMAKESNYFGEDYSTKMLINELRRFVQMGYLNERDSIITNDFEIKCVNYDLFIWNIKFKAAHFDRNPEIQQSLAIIDQRFGYQEIEFELTFTREVYPFYPPRISLIRPRFQGSMLNLLATMPELSLSTWSPVLDGGILSIFKAIRLKMETGNIDVESETNDKNNFPLGAYLPLDTLLSQLDNVRKTLDENSSVTKVVYKKNTNENNPGTLYASHGAQSWDHKQWLQAKAENSRVKSEILSKICDEFKKITRAYSDETGASKASSQEMSIGLVKHLGRVEDAINHSCLSAFILDALQTDSYVEFSKDPDLYNAVFTIILCLFEITQLHSFFLKSVHGQDILARLNKLDQGRPKQVTKSLASDTGDFALLESVLSLKRNSNPLGGADASAKAGGGGGGAGGGAVASDVGNVGDALDIKAVYVEKMREIAFGEVDFALASKGNKYNTELNDANLSKSRAKANTNRLRLEQKDICKNAPTNVFWPSSIWVRYLSGRLDSLQFAISGNDDTPYCNGLFIFDAFFSPDYPQAPPKVNLRTTGGGSVRFNPNLYNCGKVCLSLLGTWSGKNSENWSEICNMDTVFLAIQSAIMHSTPYFNEPGYQQQFGTPEGDRRNKEYNAVIRRGCIQWAMIDQIKNPKPGFKAITKLHFRLKKDEIKTQLDSWLKDDPSLAILVTELQGLLDDTSLVKTCLSEPDGTSDLDENECFL